MTKLLLKHNPSVSDHEQFNENTARNGWKAGCEVVQLLLEISGARMPNDILLAAAQACQQNAIVIVSARC